jgi:hypothetical protein
MYRKNIVIEKYTCEEAVVGPGHVVVKHGGFEPNLLGELRGQF